MKPVPSQGLYRIPLYAFYHVCSIQDVREDDPDYPATWSAYLDHTGWLVSRHEDYSFVAFAKVDKPPSCLAGAVMELHRQPIPNNDGAFFQMSAGYWTLRDDIGYFATIREVGVDLDWQEHVMKGPIADRIEPVSHLWGHALACLSMPVDVGGAAVTLTRYQSGGILATYGQDGRYAWCPDAEYTSRRAYRAPVPRLTKGKQPPMTYREVQRGDDLVSVFPAPRTPTRLTDKVADQEPDLAKIVVRKRIRTT